MPRRLSAACLGKQASQSAPQPSDLGCAPPRDFSQRFARRTQEQRDYSLLRATPKGLKGAAKRVSWLLNVSQVSLVRSPSCRSSLSFRAQLCSRSEPAEQRVCVCVCPCSLPTCLSAYLSRSTSLSLAAFFLYLLVASCACATAKQRPLARQIKGATLIVGSVCVRFACARAQTDAFLLLSSCASSHRQKLTDFAQLCAAAAIVWSNQRGSWRRRWRHRLHNSLRFLTGALRELLLAKNKLPQQAAFG